MAEARQWAEANGGVVHPVNHRNATGTEAEQQRNKTGTLKGSENADNGNSTEQNRNSSGTLPEQQRNASRAGDSFEIRKTEEQRETEVPPVPVNTAQPQPQEPPCLAHPQAIPAYAQKQEANILTNTPPALFNLATADTAESQRNGKKPASKVQKTASDADVERVWAHFRKWHPLTKQAVPKGDGEQIAICLKEWTADEIMAVFTWAHESQHENAVWLRSKDRDCVKTLTVQADFSRRLELAMREQGGKGPTEKPVRVATPEDPGQVFEAIMQQRCSTGSRIAPVDLPDRIAHAVKKIGGWYQMGLTSNFEKANVKREFIKEYLNFKPPTDTK